MDLRASTVGQSCFVRPLLQMSVKPLIEGLNEVTFKPSIAFDNLPFIAANSLRHSSSGVNLPTYSISLMSHLVKELASLPNANEKLPINDIQRKIKETHKAFYKIYDGNENLSARLFDLSKKLSELFSFLSIELTKDLRSVVEETLEFINDRTALAQGVNINGAFTSFSQVEEKLINSFEINKKWNPRDRSVPELIIYSSEKARHAKVAMSDSRLFSLINNLLVNSIKHAGGEVLLLIEINNGKLKITVQDSGRGIPNEFFLPNEEDIKLFALEKRGLRIPIGMAEIKAIVAINKGTIHIESNENLGTTFQVELELRS